jgi:hypothetical protein
MRLRQVALVAREIEPAVEALRSVLGLGDPFRDPGVAEFGLRNAVMPLGDDFLEVVSPVQPGTSAGRWLERHGDGGYMVILQVEDLARERQRLAALDVRIVWEIELPDIATLHLHPRDLGGAIVSLDAADPPGSWRWAGPGWEQRSRSEVVRGLAGLEIACRDARARAERWAQVLGRSARPRAAGFEIALEQGALHFVPAAPDQHEGVSAVAFAASDAERARKAARRLGLVAPDGSIHAAGVRLDLV